MTLKELKENLDSYIIPLHDSKWAKSKIAEAMTVGYAYPPTEDEIKKAQRGVSDGLIIGFPDPEEDFMFMFGYKDEGWLDDRSTIDYITGVFWEEIGDSNIISFGTMESHSEVWYDEESPNLRQHKKEVDDFLTHLIGRSLCGPEPTLISSTSDCKKFIEAEYGYKNMKRTANNKWGNFNYRLFETDNGEEVSIVAYNGKLISHYTFTYKD